MFNGIIFNQGLITKFEKRSKGINIFVKADLKLTRKDWVYQLLVMVFA